MNCEARKGFLTLSTCENPAATACANCGRSLCPTHLAPPDFSMCLDCAASTRLQQQQGNTAPQSECDYDDVWSHGYRSSYYSTTGYSPRSSSSFNQNDADGFKQRGGDEFEDDDTGTGFGES